MPTLTAPLLSPSVPDLSDPDEMMKVTNNSSKPLTFIGTRRKYLIQPKKTEFIPLYVVIKHLGDPRSEYKRTEMFITPTGGRGVVPERRGELIRLSVYYGLYHAKVASLPSVAPKVTVTTLNDQPITFPVHEPKGRSYPYQTSGQTNIDVRTELERMQKRQEETDARMSALLDHIESDDPEAGEAGEDTPIGL